MADLSSLICLLTFVFDSVFLTIRKLKLWKTKYSAISVKLVCVCVCFTKVGAYCSSYSRPLYGICGLAVKGSALVKDSGSNLSLQEFQHWWSSGLIRVGTKLESGALLGSPVQHGMPAQHLCCQSSFPLNLEEYGRYSSASVLKTTIYSKW